MRTQAPRFHCPLPLASGAELELPPGAARHAQVLRLQPGDTIVLFAGGPQGPDGEFDASVLHMGRSAVRVRVGRQHAIGREAPRAVHLLAGCMASERMDWLLEKATELGAASIQPLLTGRSLLRLSGPRAGKKTAHWQAIASAACEQCGRNRVPAVHPALALADWLDAHPAGGGAGLGAGAGANANANANAGAGVDAGVDAFVEAGAGAATAARAQAACAAAAGASTAVQCHRVGAAAAPTAPEAAASITNEPALRLLLSLNPGAATLAAAAATAGDRAVYLLSGPEGGLSADEQALALHAGFVPVTLGPRVLRAETAPLAALALLTLGSP